MATTEKPLENRRLFDGPDDSAHPGFFIFSIGYEFMLSRFVAGLVSASGLFSSALAHDFWIEPDNFHVNRGENVHVNFLVGHGRDQWVVNKDRVVSFDLIGADGVRDIADRITPGRDGGADIIIDKDGAYIAYFETNNAFIELDPKTFNAYLKEEGLTAVQEFRKAQKLEDRPGRELYSRRAKMIIRSEGAGGSQLTKAVARDLEIRPLADPLSLSEGDKLSVEILYNGEPLPGASVHLENISVGILPEIAQKTDQLGRASFSFPKSGAWKLNVIWSVPIESERADFQTIFSSLTFGYD